MEKWTFVVRERSLELFNLFLIYRKQGSLLFIPHSYIALFGILISKGCYVDC